MRPRDLGVQIGALLALTALLIWSTVAQGHAEHDADRWHAKFDGLVASIVAQCRVSANGAGMCQAGAFSVLAPGSTTTTTSP